jgi:hypothetical protein
MDTGTPEVKQSAGRAVLEGDLSAFHFPDVLAFLSMTRRTGRLVVRHLSLERTIFWSGGDIAFATSNSPEHSLGQFLLRNGRITPEQHEAAHQKLLENPQVRQGKLLVQMGALSPKDLWWGVKNQVLEIIYSLFSWKQGSFAFHDDGADLHEKITLSASTSSIILEGVRRIDEAARIREKIPSLDMVFAKIGDGGADLEQLELSPQEIRVFERIDGLHTVRELVRDADLTEFEVTRILFQLVTAHLIEAVTRSKPARPVFIDVEDSPELMRVVSSYNDMFERLYRSLAGAVGDGHAREIFTSALQSSDSNELWNGVFFDPSGRFDENLLIANISELPFEERKNVLDEGLNTLLSIQLFEVSQHLDQAAKVEIFRFISEQKAEIEQAG